MFGVSGSPVATPNTEITGIGIHKDVAESLKSAIYLYNGNALCLAPIQKY